MKEHDPDLPLSFFKLCKCNQHSFINVLITEILDGTFVDLSCAADKLILLLKACIFQPVLHFRMHNNKCNVVKEIYT